MGDRVNMRAPYGLAVEDVDVIKSGKFVAPGAVNGFYDTVTLAQLKAGKLLVPGVPGKKIKVLSYFVKVTGNFSSGGGTGVVLQDTNATPVVITTIGKAAMTDGAKIGSYATVTNVTDGDGLYGLLTEGKGIAIPADANLSGGTSIYVALQYMYV
jgi:hypothetical protein